MASHHLPEFDSGATDSVASSPRSDYMPNEFHSRMRFMCSFGGKILPRPHDNQLRYVGGDTRIVAVPRAVTFSTLVAKLSKLSGISTINVMIKYQLPNEDLDALISVTTDEDVENMLEEYDRLTQNPNPKAARLRLFLFSKGDDSRTSSISSLLDGSTNRGHWFFDALNGGGTLERGRSEASSILSEVPDYLFGLDNSEETQHHREPKVKTRMALAADNVSASDPGSPVPVLASLFQSTSSMASVPAEAIPDLPPVKTKPGYPVPVLESKEGQVEEFMEPSERPLSQPGGYPGNPRWHYIPDPRYSGQNVQQLPFYYMPGQIPANNFPVQSVPIRAPYVQQYGTQTGPIPSGFHHQVQSAGPVYGGGMRAVAPLNPYDLPSARMVPDGLNQQLYYGVRNADMVAPYPGVVVPGGEEIQGTGVDANMGRTS